MPRFLDLNCWASERGGAAREGAGWAGGLVLGLGTCTQLRPDGSSVVETAASVRGFRTSQRGARTHWQADGEWLSCQDQSLRSMRGSHAGARGGGLVLDASLIARLASNVLTLSCVPPTSHD